MSRAVREALREVGIELTIYWSGQFVGPQMEKLMPKKAYQHFITKLKTTLDFMKSQLSEDEFQKGKAFLLQLEQVFASFFTLFGLVKTTKKLTMSDASDIEQAVLLLSARYRKLVPGPVTPKFHAIEAHIVDFVTKFGCSWPLSEEGVESAHHWIRLFREKTSHVTGFKRKYESFIGHWTANQSMSGRAEMDMVMKLGRKHKYAPRPNRKKREFSDALVAF
jgi:hypothetical protein